VFRSSKKRANETPRISSSGLVPDGSLTRHNISFEIRVDNCLSERDEGRTTDSLPTSLPVERIICGLVIAAGITAGVERMMARVAREVVAEAGGHMGRGASLGLSRRVTSESKTNAILA
jgi:hypothetical protein